MDISLNMICYLIVLFFTVSIAGWCMEVFLKYVQYHRFMNRGFLIGPYCPIYGSGAVMITLSVGLFSKFDNSISSTFIISLLICGFWEYAVSYYLEKRFHARWWDYSHKPMNLNGRIWIGNLILFGIGGTVIVHVIDPFLLKIVSSLSVLQLDVFSICIVILFAADYTVSHFIMKFVKMCVEDSTADDTENISKEIHFLLHNKSILYSRIADAYPEVIYRTERIQKRMREVKAEVEQMRNEASKKIHATNQILQTEKNTFVMRLDPTSALKDDIIHQQDKLIALLQDKELDDESIDELQNLINIKKQQLQEKLHKPL